MYRLLATSALALTSVVPTVFSQVSAQGMIAAPASGAQPDANPDPEPGLLLPEPGEPLTSDDSVVTLPQSRDDTDALLRRQRTLRQGRNFDARGTAVLDRGRPDYDPLGIRSGGFTIYPQATLGLGIDTNVYRQPDGNADVFGFARAEALARSNWSRHQAVFDGYVQQSLYLSEADESETTYLVRGAGRLDVNGQDVITGQVLAERMAEDRGSVLGDVDQLGAVISNRARAALGARIVRGRVNGQVRLAYTHIQYSDDISGGSNLSQRYRENNQYEVGGKVGYQISPGRIAFVSIDHERRRFPFPSPTYLRDLDQTEFLAGLESEITPLIRGRAAVGYLFADFQDPTLKTRGGLAIDVEASYLYSELTTINFQARRYVRNVASPRSPSALTTTVRLGADHEYLRNVIISPSVFYESADYIGTDSKAQQFGAALDARWLINRTFRAGLTTAFRTRNGKRFVVDRDYSALAALVSLTWQR